jgi:hypothetical protein
MKLLLAALLASVTLAFAPRSRAAEAPASESSSKSHGLVLSLAAGPGLFITSSGSAADRRSFHGESVSLSLFVGGHIGRTFVFGGGYLRDEIVDLRSKDSTLDGDEPDLSHIHFFTSIFGLFGDFRIPTRPELHLVPFLGYGSLFVSGRPLVGVNVANPSGFVYAVALTSEFRLARALTLGGALRVLLGDFSVNETGAGSMGVNVVIPALLVTGRYD